MIERSCFKGGRLFLLGMIFVIFLIFSLLIVEAVAENWYIYSMQQCLYYKTPKDYEAWSSCSDYARQISEDKIEKAYAVYSSGLMSCSDKAANNCYFDMTACTNKCNSDYDCFNKCWRSNPSRLDRECFDPCDKELKEVCWKGCDDKNKACATEYANAYKNCESIYEEDYEKTKAVWSISSEMEDYLYNSWMNNGNLGPDYPLVASEKYIKEKQASGEIAKEEGKPIESKINYDELTPVNKIYFKTREEKYNLYQQIQILEQNKADPSYKLKTQMMYDQVKELDNKAEIEYKNLLKSNPNDYWANYDLANIKNSRRLDKVYLEDIKNMKEEDAQMQQNYFDAFRNLDDATKKSLLSDIRKQNLEKLNLKSNPTVNSPFIQKLNAEKENTAQTYAEKYKMKVDDVKSSVTLMFDSMINYAKKSYDDIEYIRNRAGEGERAIEKTQ